VGNGEQHVILLGGCCLCLCVFLVVVVVVGVGVGSVWWSPPLLYSVLCCVSCSCCRGHSPLSVFSQVRGMAENKDKEEELRDASREGKLNRVSSVLY